MNRTLPRSARALVSVAMVAYPLYVWWAINQLHLLAVFAPLLILVIARGFTATKQGKAAQTFYFMTAALLALAVGLRQLEEAILYYPVWMNVGLLALFAWSIWRPPSVITRMATLFEGTLDAKGVAYTTLVTKVWCAFFIANGITAFFIARYGSWDMWALYNGLIAYLLMGLLMLIEWRVRKIVRAAD